MKNTTQHISRNQKKRIQKVRKMKAIVLFIIMIAITVISGIIMIRMGIEDATGLLIFIFIGGAMLVDAFSNGDIGGGKRR